MLCFKRITQAALWRCPGVKSGRIGGYCSQPGERRWGLEVRCWQRRWSNLGYVLDLETIGSTDGLETVVESKRDELRFLTLAILCIY